MELTTNVTIEKIEAGAKCRVIMAVPYKDIALFIPFHDSQAVLTLESSQTSIEFDEETGDIWDGEMTPQDAGIEPLELPEPDEAEVMEELEYESVTYYEDIEDVDEAEGLEF